MDATVDPRSTQATGADRRRTARFDVRVTLGGAASSFRLKLENVSEGGCLVYASGRLTVGDIHQLRFAGADHHEVVLHAQVVHAIGVSGDQNTLCVAGLEFTLDESHAQQAAIAQLLALVS